MSSAAWSGEGEDLELPFINLIICLMPVSLAGLCPMKAGTMSNVGPDTWKKFNKLNEFM